MSLPTRDSKNDLDFAESEKGAPLAQLETHADGTVDFEEKDGLRYHAPKQGLHERHIQMISLAGTIGSGLFIGLGGAIANGGPLGALLGYLFIGLLVTGPVLSVGEMGALLPLSGGIVRYAEHFFDPALGFANGWNLVYGSLVGTPAEIVAAAILVDFWNQQISNGVWITVFSVLLIASNATLVSVYGELEFVFAILKIMLVFGVNIMALVITAGGGPNHHAIGFEYWRNPGPFVQYLGISGSLGRFLGFYATFLTAVYSYSGVESITVAAAETRNPRRNIPIAAKRLFWRILLFYVITVFFVGLLVPSNDPNLLQSTGTASQSPFVIAATRAGINAVPSIINAVVLTSAWSAANSGFLYGTRFLYGLAREGRAPSIFKWTNRFGNPYMCVILFGLFLSLGYLTLGNTAGQVFEWLQNLIAVSTLINWIIICITYLRFYYGMKKQNISRDRLPWKAPFQPYVAWISAGTFSLLLITGGWTTFLKGQWSDETFVASYLNIPLILVLYFGYKYIKGTKLVPLDKVPVLALIEVAEQNPEPPAEPKKGLQRLNFLWG